MQTEVNFDLYKGKVIGRFVENKETGYHAYFLTDKEKGYENKRVKGCTTIIGIKDKSAALVSWATELAREFLVNKLADGENISIEDIMVACELHKQKKKEAADIGSEIHDWCEHYIKHQLGIDGYDKLPLIPGKKEVKRGINAFLQWEDEHNVKFVSSERVVYSREHEFIGKMDVEGIVDKKLGLIDLKSSSGLYNSVKLQTAGYAKADMEEDKKKKYKTRWAIRLTKESEEEYYARMKKKKYLKEIPDYQIFEAMEFPEKPDDNMDLDYQAFLAAKTLYEWDDRTDFYKVNQRQAKNGL